MKNELERALIKNPDKMVVVLKTGDQDAIMPFKCLGLTGELDPDNPVLRFVQALYGLAGLSFEDRKNQTPSMEDEFPKCLRCPLFLKEISNVAGELGRDSIEVTGVWSRDVLAYPTEWSSQERGAPSQLGFSKN